jgi:hypothetical protein
MELKHAVPFKPFTLCMNDVYYQGGRCPLIYYFGSAGSVGIPDPSVCEGKLCISHWKARGKDGQYGTISIIDVTYIESILLPGGTPDSHRETF